MKIDEVVKVVRMGLSGLRNERWAVFLGDLRVSAHVTKQQAEEQARQVYATVQGLIYPFSHEYAEVVRKKEREANDAVLADMMTDSGAFQAGRAVGAKELYWFAVDYRDMAYPEYREKYGLPEFKKKTWASKPEFVLGVPHLLRGELKVSPLEGREDRIEAAAEKSLKAVGGGNSKTYMPWGQPQPAPTPSEAAT